MQLLDDYIKKNFESKMAFAKHMNIGYTTLHYMVRQKYIVVNDQLYSPKRKITKIKKM
jgi:hypothetical protein